MSLFSLFGLRSIARPDAEFTFPAEVLHEQSLRNIFDFTGYSIHDVINNRLARDTVRYFYHIHRDIDRRFDQERPPEDPTPLGP
jgi:hypothetical protein